MTASGKYSWQPIEATNYFYYSIYFKGALSGLRQFLAIENILKIKPYFTLKALLVPKIFAFLSWIFDHVENGSNREIQG